MHRGLPAQRLIVDRAEDVFSLLPAVVLPKLDPAVRVLLRKLYVSGAHPEKSPDPPIFQALSLIQNQLAMIDRRDERKIQRPPLAGSDT